METKNTISLVVFGILFLLMMGFGGAWVYYANQNVSLLDTDMTLKKLHEACDKDTNHMKGSDKDLCGQKDLVKTAFIIFLVLVIIFGLAWKFLIN